MAVWAICVKPKICQGQSNFQKTAILYPNPQSWGWLKINKSPQQIASWIDNWTMSSAGGERGALWDHWCPWRRVCVAQQLEQNISVLFTEELTFSMSRSLIYYPDLDVTWMDFCQSGGVGGKGDLLLSLAPVRHPAGWAVRVLAKHCWWQGTDITPGLPGQGWHLFGRSFGVVHSPVSPHWKSFPQPGVPAQLVSARHARWSQRCPAHRRPANPAGRSSRRYRCWTTRERRNTTNTWLVSPSSSTSRASKQLKLLLLSVLLYFFVVHRLCAWGGESAEEIGFEFIQVKLGGVAGMKNFLNLFSVLYLGNNIEFFQPHVFWPGT